MGHGTDNSAGDNTSDGGLDGRLEEWQQEEEGSGVPHRSNVVLLLLPTLQCQHQPFCVEMMGLPPPIPIAPPLSRMHTCHPSHDTLYHYMQSLQLLKTGLVVDTFPSC